MKRKIKCLFTIGMATPGVLTSGKPLLGAVFLNALAVTSGVRKILFEFLDDRLLP